MYITGKLGVGTAGHICVNLGIYRCGVVSVEFMQHG